MDKKHRAGLIAILAAAGMLGCATSVADRNAVKAVTEVMRSSFSGNEIAGMDRLDQDEVQALCTEYAGRELPPAIAEKIHKSQLATVRKPASGKLIGDWKAGEKIAQEARGLQFSDAVDGPKGGNCYACHQMTPQETSFGNLGPSLLKYGALRGYSPAIVEYTYNKVYNAHAYSACSNMPRFGHRNILTPEQIADVLGLLLDPQSPVNN